MHHQAVKAASKPRQFYVIEQRPPSEGPLEDSIDLRSPGNEGTTGFIKDLVDLPIDNKEPSRVLKIRKNLSNEVRKVISNFLGQNLDVFEWTHSDME